MFSNTILGNRKEITVDEYAWHDALLKAKGRTPIYWRRQGLCMGKLLRVECNGAGRKEDGGLATPLSRSQARDRCYDLANETCGAKGEVAAARVRRKAAH